ncbi:MAG TPA: dihydropteroate synthase [Lacipirellulaceae bacterium]|nr:dihydropteroate synthase [Lacipirellulaceae bacterium]
MRFTHPTGDIMALVDRYPRRAASWRLRTRTLELGRRPLVRGIVNVTPDSFSDGGKFLDPQAAVDYALELVAQGADLLDIGGESTRPYSATVEVEEERRRVLPVFESLAPQTTVPLSVDTSKALVAAGALDYGAEIINDVTALFGDPMMLPLATAAGAGVCAMHMQGTPQTMQDDPQYADVVQEVVEWLAERQKLLVAAGIAPDRLCLDPGIGFGKSHQHNLTLMASLGRFHDLACPLLVGPSRKGFLGKLLGSSERDRDAATAGAVLAAAAQGVQVVRVHNVRLAREALLAFEACGGIDGAATTLG